MVKIEGDMIGLLVKCTRQHVQVVDMKLKFHSSQMAQDLFTARNVTRRKTQEGIKSIFL